MRRLLILLALSVAPMAAPADAQTRRGPQPFEAQRAAQACPEHGPGFYRIAGTATCVRIGGQVVAEMSFGSGRSGGFIGSAPAPTTRTVRPDAWGRVTLDARTETPLGPVRAVVRTPRLGKDRDFR